MPGTPGNARDAALAYLGRFSRTEKQVAAYLKRKGFSSEEAQEALVYLRELRLVDDLAFAEAFLSSKIRRGDGPLKIKQALFQKGVDSRTSQELLSKYYPEEVQVEAAAGWIAKRKGDREKVIRFLASRGFSRYVIIQAFKRK